MRKSSLARIRLAGLFVLLVWSGLATASWQFRGMVVGISDGDTLKMVDTGQVERRIRLAQIDAPEIGHGANRPGQPFGLAAKQSLSELTYRKDALAECEYADKYGRLVCTVWVGSLNINLEQVRRGMAWVFRKYANDPVYYRAEEEAKIARRGLWRQEAIPPWEWRKSH